MSTQKLSRIASRGREVVKYDSIRLGVKTANQGRAWPCQASSWFGTSVSVGRTKNLLKTLQFKRICPTYACTTPVTLRI